MAQTLTELQQKQIQQAEELLFSGPQKDGFAKDLFLGKFRSQSMLPYPKLPEVMEKRGDELVAQVRDYCHREIDAERIDREARIPDDVVAGLGRLGVLGATVSSTHGGLGIPQQTYCRIMEEVGAHCGSTAVFVNAHHSIGLRGLELFGSEEQKDRWMKPLATGQQMAAFALTEPEAGSDASNVQTRAETERRRRRLHHQRRKTLDYQRRDRGRVDRHGAHPR